MLGIGGRNAALGVVGIGLMTMALCAPASAQGIFERIFGGFRHAIEGRHAPMIISSFADPSGDLGRSEQRAESGPARGFCVRISDGFYFPVQSRPGLSATESCSAFCPGSKTAVYSGSTIDNAVTNDGGRYADLDNAFLYRKRLVAGSTCNGRDAFGLAHIDINNDPTLRRGDVVATKTGLIAFTGTTDKVATFTPATTRPLDDRRRAQLDR